MQFSSLQARAACRIPGGFRSPPGSGANCSCLQFSLPYKAPACAVPTLACTDHPGSRVQTGCAAMKGLPHHAADPGQGQGRSGGCRECVGVGWDLHRPLIHRAGGRGTVVAQYSHMRAHIHVLGMAVGVPHSHCTPLQAIGTLAGPPMLDCNCVWACFPSPVLCAAATASCPPEAAAFFRSARLQLHLGSLCSQILPASVEVAPPGRHTKCYKLLHPVSAAARSYKDSSHLPAAALTQAGLHLVA